ncbi:hypothetical protein GCM10009809_03460 [Isoptericola hypogeus]|uniref:Sporulation stage II protein D amidase enhancer LytB N-terminal domain-containing protein n=1 Tax=Isoptericola hypogeus TaxID=300179 RepID=A0ABN2IRR9_9MICO
MHATWARRLLAGATSTLLVAAGLTAGAGAAQGSAPDRSSTATPSTATALAAVPDSFRIAGSGFGHGVGMPQYGAYELSRRGANGSDVLRYYYTGAQVLRMTTPATVSVQLYGPDPYAFAGYGDSSDTTYVHVTGGSWRLRTEQGDTVASGSGNTRFKVTTAGETADGRVRVRVDGKLFERDLLRLHWSGTRYYDAGGPDALVDIDGSHGTYRHGRLTLTEREDIPNVVNDLLLNTEYLYGLAEMPSSWGLNGGAGALRAQAMAARSYALLKTQARNPACDCHLVDDVRDQHFTGWDKENEGTGGRYGAVWKAAVNRTVDSSTSALGLAYDGEPVAAHYYSSSGGRTADSEDVWASVVPYERSVSDPYSKVAPGNSYASWTRTITQAQAADLFDLPVVVSIAVTSRWTSGQARTLVATNRRGTTSTITGKADQIRAVLGARTTAGSLPASWITSIRPS